MMNDDERQTLHAAAVFASRFSATDVAAILSVDEAIARDRLAALVERSMAHRDSSWFSLLAIVRRFAIASIEPDELTSLRIRHARRMHDKALELAMRVRRAADASPVDDLARALPDLRTATMCAIEGGDAALALEMVIAVRDFCLNAMRHEPMRWAGDAAELGDRTDHPLAADGFAMAAMGAWKRSDLGECRELLARADATAARLHLGERHEVVATVATESLAHGRLADAIEQYDRAAQTAAVDDPLRRAASLATKAVCMSYAHRPDAIDEADRVAAMLVPIGGAIAAAWCWYAAGECRLDADPAAAREYLDRAVAAARRGGSTFVECVAGASLASLDVRCGESASAIAQYRQLLPLWMQAGVRAPFWTAMRTVAGLLHDIGEHEASAQLLGAVLAPSSGHAVYGDDVGRLSLLRDRLATRLGPDVLDRLLAEGAEIDDAAAARLATAAFDRYG
jgi:hypothetical protein